MTLNNFIRKRIWICFTVFALFGLYGCSVALIPTPTPTNAPPPSWLASYLSSSTCQPPCWENITPGKTKMDDAVKIVKSRTDIRKFDGPNAHPNERRTQIEWIFSDNRSFGLIDSDEKGEFVEFVRLSSFDMTFHAIIEKYGEPDQIYFSGTENLSKYDIFIIYSNQNMRLVTGDSVKNGIILISPERKISGIELFKDGWIENYIKRQNDPKRLFQWHGFGEYKIP